MRRVEHLEQPRRVRARELGRVAIVGEAARGLAQRLDTLRERRALAQLEHERPPRRAERLVDPPEHASQRARAVGREQLQPRRILAGAELLERGVERLAREHRRLRLVELAEARVEPGLERIRAQEPRAEAVDGRDPGAVELAREVGAPARAELAPDPRAQLARSLARVRDHEHGAHVEPALADGPGEALDQHGRLAGAGAGGEEDASLRVDGALLLGVRPEAHARRTLHIGHRSHHCGHSPPLGSWRTSPPRIRCARPRAVVRAFSTCPQNASSSR